MNKLSIIACVLASVSTIAATSQEYKTTYQYDARARLIQVSSHANGTILYQYDDAGNRTLVTQEGVLPPSTSAKITAFYSGWARKPLDPVSVSWRSENTSRCSMTPGSHINLEPSGSIIFRFKVTTTVSLTCFGQSDSDTKTQQISVGGGEIILPPSPPSNEF